MSPRPLYGYGRRRVSVRDFWRIQAEGGEWRPQTQRDALRKDALRLEPTENQQLTGYVGKVLFTYSTAELSKTNRVRFFYSLKGRGTQPGIIEWANGVHLGPGVVLVPKRYAKNIEEFMQDFGSNYNRMDIWVLPPSKRMRIREAFEKRSVK